MQIQNNTNKLVNMKKYLFSIAFLGFVAVNATAQNSADYLHSATSENEVYYEIEDLGRGNVLSDFLSFVIRQQYSEAHQTRQSGWMLGFQMQSGFIVGGIQNHPATMRLSSSMQFGAGFRYQINSRHSLTSFLGGSITAFNIRNGLKNDILGEFSQFPLVGHSVDEISLEGFRKMGIELAFGYRFNFDRNRRFGVVGSFVEIGVFGGWAEEGSQYFVQFLENNGNTIAVNYANPNVLNPFEAGIQVSIAWDGMAIYGRYRLTNPFKNLDATLPPLIIGLRIGF